MKLPISVRSSKNVLQTLMTPWGLVQGKADRPILRGRILFGILEIKWF